MMNPVLRKEAITTMRSWKTYGALVLFLVISAVGAMLYIDLAMFQNRDLSFDPSSMVWLYVVLAAVQMGLVLLTAPAVAAGSISGERERQTLDLLSSSSFSRFRSSVTLPFCGITRNVWFTEPRSVTIRLPLPERTFPCPRKGLSAHLV